LIEYVYLLRLPWIIAIEGKDKDDAAWNKQQFFRIALKAGLLWLYSQHLTTKNNKKINRALLLFRADNPGLACW